MEGLDLLASDQAAIFAFFDTPQACDQTYDLMGSRSVLGCSAWRTQCCIARSRVMMLSGWLYTEYGIEISTQQVEHNAKQYTFSFEFSPTNTIIINIDYSKNLADRYCVLLCSYEGGAKQKTDARTLEQACRCMRRVANATSSAATTQKRTGSLVLVPREKLRERMRVRSKSVCSEPCKKRTDSAEKRRETFVNTDEELQLLAPRKKRGSSILRRPAKQK